MPKNRVDPSRLQEFAADALRVFGVSPPEANEAAKVLVWASLRGVDTHGIRNLVPYYIDNLRNGQLVPNATVTVEHETNNSARINAGSGVGLISATSAMRLAIAKAQGQGVGMVAVHNTHHLGPAGYYAHMAIQHDMLGFCTTGHFFGKGNEIGVAPIHGLTAMFSTNPLSFAAPCGRKPPFVLDMSTAVATVNRIESYAQRDTAIPQGWAKDAAGNPTTDPHRAKVLFPLGGDPQTGGHKGVGLSMMVSILSGVLSGGWSQLHTGCDYDQPTMGHFCAAIRIDQFMPVGEFTAAMDALLESVQTAPTTNSEAQIHYPGSQEHETELERSRLGIPLDDRLIQEFLGLAKDLDISVEGLFD